MIYVTETKKYSVSENQTLIQNLLSNTLEHNTDFTWADIWHYFLTESELDYTLFSFKKLSLVMTWNGP